MRSVLVLALACAACRVGHMSPEEFDRKYPIGRLTTLAQPGRGESLAALRASVGGSPVRVTSLSFYDDRTYITAQDPREPRNFDTYSYWEGDVTKSAVTIHGDAEQRLLAELFELDSVPFDQLPELARRAFKELPIDGARVSRVDVSRGDTDLEIVMTIDGERRDGRVRFDARGTLLSAAED